MQQNRRKLKGNETRKIKIYLKKYQRKKESEDCNDKSNQHSDDKNTKQRKC